MSDTLCTECQQPIEADNLISFIKLDKTVNYHRQCYATRFNAPHALLDDNGIAKPPYNK